MNKIETRDVNFWYGNFHALKGISMEPSSARRDAESPLSCAS